MAPKNGLSRQETPNSVWGAKGCCTKCHDNSEVHDDDDDDDDDDDVEEENRSQDREAYFARAGIVEMHMDISQEPFCVEIYRENAGRVWEHLDQTPGLNPHCKKPKQCGHTVWGMNFGCKHDHEISSMVFMIWYSYHFGRLNMIINGRLKFPPEVSKF